MDDDVMDLRAETDPQFDAGLLAEGLALLPPRTTEYRSGDIRYPWAEEPATLPIPVPLAPPAAPSAFVPVGEL
ncbi:hypothetical protein [Frankia nepalensis]|uniref:Uncharacterized protein n=1 Tax=Frankia nepalensis TaxID=1836974 RepID=A0A937RJQ5_9ACTN|nr:hypothetical protein [Frankia nepalensis]MBL7500136.1 hypothetical protein [Frankia nepalensis]MBL7511168.1 hypothetical protein [Frankia nepalensis]MBL7631580.1 hypothetical protein [Frankia nepalensis]